VFWHESTIILPMRALRWVEFDLVVTNLVPAAADANTRSAARDLVATRRWRQPLVLREPIGWPLPEAGCQTLRRP